MTYSPSLGASVLTNLWQYKPPLLKPMSHKGSDADPMGFWEKNVIFGRWSDDCRGGRPVICVSNRQSVYRRAKLKIHVSDVLPIFPIVEPSTGNPVMPARTSWTSARHRSTDCRLGAPPSKLWNRPMSPKIVGRSSADGRPMICRLPADYKESANFKGHGPTPASGRSSRFVHDWLQIDVAAHPTSTFSHLWSVLPPRPIRSKVAR